MDLISIKNSIVSTLKIDSDLKLIGVKNVFEGDRDQVSVDEYPNIRIEIVSNDESEREINNRVDLVATIAIGCYMKIEDVDSQLDSMIGFETAVKKSLSQDPTLGGVAIDRVFLTSLYDNEYWPIRGVIVQMQVKYRQTYKTRT